MDEVLLKQLVRQLKILNIWISIVGTLILTSLIICIVLIYKVVTFVQHTADQVTSIQQKTENSLNVKSQLCDNNSIRSFLKDKSQVCSQ
jgi:hypothetical protein